MNLLRIFCLTAMLGACMISSGPSRARAAVVVDDYWPQYWNWYDGTYQPYYSWYYGQPTTTYYGGLAVQPYGYAPYYSGPNVYVGRTYGPRPYGDRGAAVRVGRYRFGWR